MKHNITLALFIVMMEKNILLMNLKIILINMGLCIKPLFHIIPIKI